jgi:hypothetical protein
VIALREFLKERGVRSSGLKAQLHWLTLLNNIVVMSLIQIQQIARGLLHYAPRFNGFFFFKLEKITKLQKRLQASAPIFEKLFLNSKLFLKIRKKFYYRICTFLTIVLGSKRQILR